MNRSSAAATAGKLLDFVHQIIRTCMKDKLSECPGQMLSIAKAVGFELPGWAEGVVIALSAAVDQGHAVDAGGVVKALKAAKEKLKILWDTVLFECLKNIEKCKKPTELVRYLVDFIIKLEDSYRKDEGCPEGEDNLNITKCDNWDDTVSDGEEYHWSSILVKIVDVFRNLHSVMTTEKGYHELQADGNLKRFGEDTYGKFLWWCLGKRCLGGHTCEGIPNKTLCENTPTEGECKKKNQTALDTFECHRWNKDRQLCDSAEAEGCHWVVSEGHQTGKCTWGYDFTDCLSTVAETICDSVNPIYCEQGQFLHGGAHCSWHMFSQATFMNTELRNDPGIKYSLLEDDETDVRKWFDTGNSYKTFVPLYDWPDYDMPDKKCTTDEDCKLPADLRAKLEGEPVWQYECIKPCNHNNLIDSKKLEECEENGPKPCYIKSTETWTCIGENLEEFGTCGSWRPVLGPWDVKKDARDICWKTIDGKADQRLPINRSISCETEECRCLEQDDVIECFNMTNGGQKAHRRVKCKDSSHLFNQFTFSNLFDEPGENRKSTEDARLSRANIQNPFEIGYAKSDPVEFCKNKELIDTKRREMDNMSTTLKQVCTLFDSVQATTASPDGKTITHTTTPTVGEGPWLRKYRGLRKCTPCLPGTYVKAETTSDGDCKKQNILHKVDISMCEMHKGKWDPECKKLREEVGKTCWHSKPRCEKCAEGRFQEEYGQHECKNCPAGWASGICIACNKTKQEELFEKYNEHEYDQCYECPPGMFGLHTTTVPNSYNELRGDYSNHGADKMYGNYVTYRQVKTKYGYRYKSPQALHNNSKKYGICQQCPSGYYNDQEGSRECKECKAGKYSRDSYPTYCTACTGGKTSENKSTQCVDCPIGQSIGQYSDASKQFKCSPCPIGKYSDASAGTNECRFCPRGFFKSKRNSTKCTSCADQPGLMYQFPRDKDTTHKTGSNSSEQCVCHPGSFDLFQAADSIDSIPYGESNKTMRCGSVISSSKQKLEEVRICGNIETDCVNNKERCFPARCDGYNITVESLIVRPGYW
jgi:hypothetical protein